MKDIELVNDYIINELEDSEYFRDGDGWRDKDGIYYDDDEIIEAELDNAKKWEEKQ